jgi:hypothetical protein
MTEMVMESSFSYYPEIFHFIHVTITITTTTNSSIEKQHHRLDWTVWFVEKSKNLQNTVLFARMIESCPVKNVVFLPSRFLFNEY